MSLFQCDKCGVMENTALTYGHLAHIMAPEELVARKLDPKGKYCSACYEGQWHGVFPQEFFPLGSMITDKEGNLVPKP